VAFSGLAVFNPANSELIIGVTGQSAQQGTIVYYGIVSDLIAS
jgi:hypothetical protein